jgi:HEAT repeat protein
MQDRVRRTVAVWTAVAAIVGLVSESSSAGGQTSEWDAVLTLVERIKAEPAVTPRTEKAQELAHVVKEREAKTAPKEVIQALAGLMADRDDSVRYWVAMALGYMGPQADDAIPALEKALREIEGSPASKTSESAIRLALKRIKTPSK